MTHTYKILLAICSVGFFVSGPIFAAAQPSINASSLQAAQQIEDAFSEVVNHAKPAVVVITNKQIAPEAPEMQDLPEEFYRFFGIPRQRGQGGEQNNRRGSRRNKPVPAGKGSGVLFSPEGYFVTNYHVIENHSFLEVKTSDGKIYDNEKDQDAVRVVGVDKETDLAVLQIGGGEKKDFPSLEFADSDNLRVGQWTIAIGAPFNFDYSVTIGCVSQKGRYDTGMSTYENYIQTDASINPGNSGGPLLNISGQIIGINQFIYTGGMSRGSIGLGFAIASNLVRQVADSLVANGEVVRPFIGIAMQELSPEIGKQFGADFGVLVSEVIAGEAAEQAGLKNGDIIQKVGGQQVFSPHDLLLAVTKYSPGDKIELVVKRDGEDKKFTVLAGQRSNDLSAKNNNSRFGRPGGVLNKLGLRLRIEDERVVVQEVLPDGAVAEAAEGENGGVRAGDMILEVNRIPVKSVTEFAEALEKTRNNTVILYVERPDRRQGRNYRFFVPVPISENSK